MELMTVDEAAQFLRLSKSMIYLLATSGRLRKVKIGAALRFRRGDLEDFVNRCTQNEREPITA